MHKDTALIIIKRKLTADYGTRTAAAEALGVSRNNLQLALDDKLAQIPRYLLDYAGLEAIRPVVTYRKKVEKQNAE
jgi:hypothetical protein